MTIEIDASTGLPVLPAGHYWHVRKAATTGWHYVEIRKGWVYPFSIRVCYDLLSRPITKFGVKDCAMEAYREFVTLHNGKTLRGSYPPKTLEVK